tara:strand:- start:503 stop:847 length:345 start_codon:yes stop_codon:yes gene_type:complete
MKVLNLIFVFSPLLLLSQSTKPGKLELSMFNNKEVVVSVDGMQYDACSKFELKEVSSGDHQIRVYQTKKYVNPLNQTVSKRLIPVFYGEVHVSDNKCTSCVINEYHQNEVKIKK